MNKRFALFLAFSLAFLASSCKKETVPVKATGEALPNVAVNVVNTEFNTFSARGRMQLESPEQNIGSAVTIRIKKDSVIWLSIVPAFGIEAARARITPDTIQVMNRLQREYFAGNFQLLQKRYNIAANFEMLQAMLLGNYLPATNGEAVKELKDGEMQQIQMLRDNLLINQFLDVEMRKLKRLQIIDEKTGDAVTASYNEFETQGNNLFPTAILMLLQRASNPDPNSKAASVAIKYSKFSVNEPGLEFPFSVPADYQRK